MRVLQGVKDALLGFLNVALKYGLTATSVFCVALAHHLEGGSYLGASLNLAFFCLLLGLLLAPNPQIIALAGLSPIFRPLCHGRAKLWAIFTFQVGHSLLVMGIPQETVFLREVGTIFMTLSLALVLPVTRLEAMGIDHLDTPNTALGTSEWMPAAVSSDEEGCPKASSTGRWQNVYCFTMAVLAAFGVVLICVGTVISYDRMKTSADVVLADPMMANSTIIVNDTVIVKDICPLRLEVPAKANMTMSSIPVSNPDLVTTLGTPCQVSPTPAPPSPVPKSTWVPAAMSTPMPTPEPTPTSLPDVELEPEADPDPEVESESEPQPETAAAPQDVYCAFQLFVKLLTSEVKSVLTTQAESAVSWHNSLRLEDQLVVDLVFWLSLVLLFCGPVVAIIAALYVFPLTCLLPTGLFFCLQRYGFSRNHALIICVVVCVVSIVTHLTLAFFARLLKLVKLLKSHDVELPKLRTNLAEAERKHEGFVTTSQETTSYIGQIISQVLGLLPPLEFRIRGLESQELEFATRIKSLEDQIRRLQDNQADPKDVKKLQRAMEDVKTQFSDFKNNAVGDEALKKLEKTLQSKLDKLSGDIDDTFECLIWLHGRFYDHKKEVRTRFRGIDKHVEIMGQETCQKMKALATKKDLNKRATKKDLKKLATKKDLNRYATEKNVNKVREDLVESLDDTAKKACTRIDQQHNETKAAIKKSDEDLRAAQASYESEVNQKLQSKDDEIDQLRKELDKQRADNNKRFDEIFEQVNTNVHFQVAQQIRTFFAGTQFHLIISGILSSIIQQAMPIIGGGLFDLWAAHPRASAGRQPHRLGGGPSHVPPEAGSGGRWPSHIGRVDLSNVGAIWRSIHGRLPRWPNAWDLQAVDRLLLDFFDSQMPRSLTPPNYLHPSSSSPPADNTGDDHGLNTFPHGPGTGEQSQGSDGSAPGSSSSGAEGPSDNTSNGGSDSAGNKHDRKRAGRTPEQEEASKLRQEKRLALLGFPIDHPSGAVIDPKGNPGDGPVACVYPHARTPDISLVGDVVDCKPHNGEFRSTNHGQWKDNRVVAHLRLPGEIEYDLWIKTYRSSVQRAAGAGAPQPGSPPAADTHGAGGHGSSPAARDSSPSPGATNPSSPPGHAGPSSSGSGSSSFRGSSGSPAPSDGPSGRPSARHLSDSVWNTSPSPDRSSRSSPSSGNPGGGSSSSSGNGRGRGGGSGSSSGNGRGGSSSSSGPRGGGSSSSPGNGLGRGGGSGASAGNGRGGSSSSFGNRGGRGGRGRGSSSSSRGRGGSARGRGGSSNHRQSTTVAKA